MPWVNSNKLIQKFSSFTHKCKLKSSDEHTELRPCTVVRDPVSFKKYFLDVKPSKNFIIFKKLEGIKIILFLEWGNFQPWSPCPVTCGNQSAIRVKIEISLFLYDQIMISCIIDLSLDTYAGLSEGRENSGCQKLQRRQY